MSGLTQLEDDEFWSAPSRTKADVQRRLSEEGFRGVVLDAPERMPLDGRSTLPVVGWRVASFREAQRVSFEAFAIVVAVTQAGGETLAGRLYEPRVMDTSKTKGFKKEDPGEGTSYAMFTFDLRSRVGVPLAPDACLVTLIVQDQASNRVTSVLSKPHLAYRDPAVQAFLAERAGEAALEARQPSVVTPRATGELPSYRRGPASLNPPAKAGIVLALASEAKRGRPCVLRASFRLPVPEDLEVEAGADVGDPQAKAVLPIGLVLTGDRLPGPYVLQTQAPVYEAPEPETRLASGHMALDLSEHMRLPAQTYYVYAFAGAVLAGPRTFTLEDV